MRARGWILLVAGLLLWGHFYTQDDANRLAAGAARSICSARPQPMACQTGNPADLARQPLGLEPQP